MCLITRSIVYKNILRTAFWLYIISIIRMKNDRYSTMNVSEINFLEYVEKRLKQQVQKNYFVLLAKIHSPKNQILDLVPLTIGKTINLMIEQLFEEKLEDFYGLFNH